MMNIRTAYRNGDTYSFQPDESAEPVRIAFAGGVEVRRTAVGTQLVVRRGESYGVSLQQAMAQGWCWVEEAG